MTRQTQVSTGRDSQTDLGPVRHDWIAVRDPASHGAMREIIHTRLDLSLFQETKAQVGRVQLVCRQFVFDDFHTLSNGTWIILCSQPMPRGRQISEQLFATRCGRR